MKQTFDSKNNFFVISLDLTLENWLRNIPLLFLSRHFDLLHHICIIIASILSLETPDHGVKEISRLPGEQLQKLKVSFF